jgi:hypothetical protein
MPTKYGFKHEEKSADRPNRPSTTPIPPEFAQALEAEWTELLAALDAGKNAYDLVLPMDSAKDVAIHAAHARRWGIERGQGNNDVRRVEIRKLPPREADGTPEERVKVLRLSLSKYDPNAPKLGRKAGNKTAKGTANAAKDAEKAA